MVEIERSSQWYFHTEFEFGSFCLVVVGRVVGGVSVYLFNISLYYPVWKKHINQVNQDGLSRKDHHELHHNVKWLFRKLQHSFSLLLQWLNELILYLVFPSVVSKSNLVFHGWWCYLSYTYSIIHFIKDPHFRLIIVVYTKPRKQNLILVLTKTAIQNLLCWSGCFISF